MKTIHGNFTSQPHNGRIYIAERSRKGARNLLWSVMPEHDGTDVRIGPREVPLAIRRQAYRILEIPNHRPVSSPKVGDGVAPAANEERYWTGATPPPPIGTRVRNRVTDELATVVTPRPNTLVRHGEVAVEYDNDPHTQWSTRLSRLRLEVVS
jgi:hypothetical protein